MGFRDGTRLEFFSHWEFDHPALMCPDFLKDLDDLRRECGFPIRLTDDARTVVDMARIYGPDRSGWPDSAHLYREAEGTEPEYAVRAVDCKPAGVLSFQERETRELRIVHVATSFFVEGRWPSLGLELATRHLHIDDYRDPVRARRPTIFPGVSR